MKRIRILFIIVTGIFLISLFISGITNISMNYPVLLSSKIGSGSVNAIKGFSEILPKIYRLTQSNYYQVGNDFSSEGINHINKGIPKNLKLLVNYHVSRYAGIIELIDIDKNEIIKKWTPDGKLISQRVYDLGGDITKGQELFINHPIMLNDSSIIANTGGAIFKIDSRSNISWIKTIKSHHSLELDTDGFIWGCGRQPLRSYKGISFKKGENIRDDLIFKLNPENGELLFSKSVIEILIENQLDHLLFSNGYFELDAIHLNDVQPALKDGDFWKKGDLLLSSKHLSCIFLYRPDTNEILWYKRGPWLNQHDPDFYDNDKIVVFGNQNFRGGDAKYVDHAKIFNNIFVYDFKNDTVKEPYKRLLVTQNIKTYTQGRSEILANGDIFIEETDNGRIIIGDSINKKVEFVRRADENHVRVLHWGRILKD